MSIPKNFADFLRGQYPEGTQIKLLSLKQADHRLGKGDSGTLLKIDDEGQFHVLWKRGFISHIIPGEDSVVISQPEWNSLKLYMPLCAEWADDGGPYDEEGVSLSDREILCFADAIQATMVRNCAPEELQRGIMHWYSEDDSVNAKVKSVRFNVEERSGKLWGVAECGVVGVLTDSELQTLKAYITGQASDGWGEGFEQHGIETGEGEIYVHLWDFGDWDIQTEEERFQPKVADGLPPLCFSTLPSTGELICIKRGEPGYYPSDWSTSSRVANQELADFNNQKLGVSDAQRLAMECGSMHGWAVPSADPACYLQATASQKYEEADMRMEM